MNKKDEFLSVIKFYPKVKIQNVLMKIPVKELAICLKNMEYPEQEQIFKLLPGPKKKLLIQEIRYIKKLSLTYDKCNRILELVIEYFKKDDQDFSFESYIRPKKQRNP